MTHSVALAQLSSVSLWCLIHILTDSWPYHTDSTTKEWCIHQILMPHRHTSEPSRAFDPCALQQQDPHRGMLPTIRALTHPPPTSKGMKSTTRTQLHEAISQWSSLTARVSCWTREKFNERSEEIWWGFEPPSGSERTYIMGGSKERGSPG